MCRINVLKAEALVPRPRNEGKHFSIIKRTLDLNKETVIGFDQADLLMYAFAVNLNRDSLFKMLIEMGIHNKF